MRPVVEVRLRNKEATIRYEVLVDSGADICIFDPEIGEAIGIHVTEGNPKEVFGVGGKASVYYRHKVTIEIGGWPYEIEAGFMPRVSGKNTGLVYGIVGQEGFFDKFVVKFDRQKEEIELKKKD